MSVQFDMLLINQLDVLESNSSVCTAFLSTLVWSLKVY